MGAQLGCRVLWWTLFAGQQWLFEPAVKRRRSSWVRRNVLTCRVAAIPCLTSFRNSDEYPREGCLKCGGAHFQRDCNARKSTGKQSSCKGKQSKSWSKSEGKGKSKENKGKSTGTKGANQGAKGIHKSKTSKTGLSGLENSKSDASSDIQESAQTFTTDTSWNEGVNGDEWNDGSSFDAWNDDWSSVGWHEGWEQTYDTSASSFSLGGLDDSATSSPKRFEWEKMYLDTGAAVNKFPLTLVQKE